jgi:transposase InsO family protein
MAIQEVLSAPRSRQQRAYVERVIGTIRRECLDHVIAFNEASLYRHVKSFLAYYHESEPILSWKRTRRKPAQCKRLTWAGSLRSRRWAGCITATSLKTVMRFLFRG